MILGFNVPNPRAIALLLALLGLMTVPIATRAQQTVTAASLNGLVLDQDSSHVSGVNVSARNLDTNQSQTVVTDGGGRFRFARLPIGNYEIVVDGKNFARLLTNVTLTVGQVRDITLKLTLVELSATVDVTANTTLIDSGRTQLAETIAPHEVDSLPLNGRNYLDLAALTPGVSRSNPVSNQRFPETSAVPGTGISFGGQRFINNGFVVDGLSSNDDAADLPRTFYSQEVIREFEVINSSGIAEFGRASGGFVNIVTRSGNNQFQGRLYGYLRNQRFDARNPLATTKEPLTQGQYGGSLGGPIRRDRTFFFANLEQTHLNDGLVVTIHPADVSSINDRLLQLGYRGEQVVTGIAPAYLRSTNFLARVDHEFSKRQQFTARYSIYDLSASNSRNVGGLNASSRGTSLNNRDQIFAASHVMTLSKKTLNETRFQYVHSELSAPPNDEIGPAVNISGVANFGTATVSPTVRNLDTVEVADVLSHQMSKHGLKVGFDYLLDRLTISFPGALQGVYSFSSLANFQSGRYTTFQQAFGVTDQFQSNPNFGVFFQDEWRAGQHLTINFGVRYDAQFLPDPIATDANNFAPRLGVAYASSDGKTVVRAGFGIYYDRVPLRATSNALQRDGVKYKVAVLSFGQASAPSFPQTLTSFPPNLLVSITTIDPQVANSYSLQTNLQIERELPGSITLAVGYIQSRGLHLIISRNLNVPRFPASANVPNLGRPDPRFANVGNFESSGAARYDGLIVGLNRRFRSWLGLRLAYSYAKTLDNAGNAFFFTPQDNFNLRDEWGRSDNDQRHHFSLSGTFQVPRKTGESLTRRFLNDLQLSYIFTAGSNLPFNILTGNDRNFDTTVNDRPIGIGRNTGVGFDFASLDLRASRRFKIGEKIEIEGLVEGFNILNRENLQLPNNVFGTGVTPLKTFGAATAAADPRQLQFGLRLSF